MGFCGSSSGKESTCNSGDPGSICGFNSPIPGGGIGYQTPVFLGFSGGLAGKESAYDVGDLDLIPGLERSPGEGNGYSLQSSCLENSMDRGWQPTVDGVAKSRTRQCFSLML